MSNETHIGEEFINFMVSFLSEYSEYQGRDFYITGESYAGKFIPVFAKAVLDYNEKDPRAANL